MNRRGFALMSALWLVVAMAVLGTELAMAGRTRNLTVVNSIEGVRARAAAEAGTEHARARLAQRQVTQTLALQPGDGFASPDPWRHVEIVLPDSVVMGDQRYRVTLIDANALVNLNTAEENQLRRFFSALRIDAGKADQLAQSIIDWRDADSLPHLHGAEIRQYLRDGLRAMPRNAPLVRADELRDVYGMTPALYDRIRSLVTVRGSGQVNLNSASLPVLLSLPGFTDEVAAAVMRLRSSGIAISGLEQVAATLSPGTRTYFVDATAELIPKVTFETREVEVVSEGWLARSPVRERISGLFVRAAGSVFFMDKRTE